VPNVTTNTVKRMSICLMSYNSTNAKLWINSITVGTTQTLFGTSSNASCQISTSGYGNGFAMLLPVRPGQNITVNYSLQCNNLTFASFAFEN
jgi:hypothetical protein